MNRQMLITTADIEDDVDSMDIDTAVLCAVIDRAIIEAFALPTDEDPNQFNL